MNQKIISITKIGYLTMILFIGTKLAYAETAFMTNEIISRYGRGNGSGQLWDPAYTIFDEEDNFYVLDKENCRVQKYDKEGNFLENFGKKGLESSEFLYPQGMAIDKEGNIYIVDSGNHRVQKFDKDGNFLMKFGSKELIEIPPLEDEFFEMLKFPPEMIEELKKPRKVWASGTGDGEFTMPTAVTVDSAGNIYVVDMNDTRLQKFSPAGNFIYNHKIKTYSFGVTSGESAEIPQANVTLQGIKTAGKVEEGPDSTFRLGEVYSFPNPAMRTNPTFHIEVGIADKVEIRIYDLSGDLVHETSLSGNPRLIDDGQGPQYAYEYTWDVSDVGSGVYVYVMIARKGSEKIKKVGKCAVIK